MSPLLAELDTDQRKEDIRQLQQILLDDGRGDCTWLLYQFHVQLKGH